MRSESEMLDLIVGTARDGRLFEVGHGRDSWRRSAMAAILRRP